MVGNPGNENELDVVLFTKQGITFTALLPICNDLIPKSTPYVALPLHVNLPSMYCLTILVFPTPESPISTKQIIVFCFHSIGWYHNFKVYASSIYNSVTAHTKPGWKVRRVKKMWQISRSYKNISASSWAFKLCLKCISSPSTHWHTRALPSKGYI